VYYIKVTPEFGRGLYASHTIYHAQTIETAEVLVLNQSDTEVVNTTDLRYYTFKYDDTRDCLVLGNGEIFNHSDEPNVSYKLMDIEGRKQMCFIALKRINRGEQLFIDYKADVVSTVVSEYTSNKSLME